MVNLPPAEVDPTKTRQGLKNLPFYSRITIPGSSSIKTSYIWTRVMLTQARRAAAPNMPDP